MDIGTIGEKEGQSYTGHAVANIKGWTHPSPFAALSSLIRIHVEYYYIAGERERERERERKRERKREMSASVR